MIDEHGAIFINIDQSARLIEKSSGERNTELDRSQGNAFLLEGILFIEIVYGLFPFGIIGFYDQLIENGLQANVLQLLSIWGDDILFLMVEVLFANIGGIFFQKTCDAIDGMFDNSYALRSSETTKGGIGKMIGAPGRSRYFYIGNKIGILGMQHGTFQYGHAEICCMTGIGIQIDLVG